MNIKRIESRCYAAVLSENGQWQKDENKEFVSDEHTETLIYDAQGNLVEACYGEEYHFFFTYDTHGNCLSSHLYDFEDEQLTNCWEEKQYRYNDLQQKVECITYENGEWKKTITFDYDAQGNNISQHAHTTAHKYLLQLVYDTQNRCIERYYIDITTGQKIFHHLTNFHSDTERVDTSLSEKGQPFVSTTMRFDPKGNLIYTAHQNTGETEPYSITESTFDAHRNEIFYRVSNAEGEVYTRENIYQYDTHGNWTACVILYSKQYTNLIVERNIQYGT